MARPLRKPDPIVVGPLTVYPEREPTEKDARWWWRGYTCIKGDKRKPVFGRGSPADIEPLARVWVHENIDRPADKPDLSKGYTVRDAAELWLGRKASEMEADQITARSLLAYTASVRRLISRKREGTIGDLVLDALEETAIEDYALARAAAGHAPKTVNDDVSVLQMVLKYARQKRWTTCPLLSPKPLAPRPKRPTRTPTREEILALIEELPPRYGLLIWLMYATGSRVGEIAALEWADCRLGPMPYLSLGRHAGAAKTGEREVPIGDEVAEALRTWRDRTEDPKGQGRRQMPLDIRARWVLGVQPVTAVSRTMKLLPAACARVAARLGLAEGRFTSHAIRRWATDEMGRSDVEPATGASVQGHSAAEAARRYRRPSLDDKRRAVERARLGAVLPFTSS